MFSRLKLLSCSLLTATAIAFALSSPARAQFVCAGSATGAEPQTGAGASVSGAHSVACGPSSRAAIESAVSVGYGSSAVPVAASSFFSSHFFDGGIGTTGSTAVGTLATAIGINSTAIGDRALVGMVVNDPVFGVGIAPVDNGTAIGSHASVEGAFSTSVGVGATSNRGTAIGYNSRAVGPGTGPQNDFAVAVGNSARADDLGAVSVGASSNFDGAGAYSVGIGASSTSSGDRSIAIGGAGSLGDAATAATATGSIAIGAGAKSTHANSIALGSGTRTTAENQVHVGGRTIGGVAAGVADTDAVNVAQLNAATSGITADVTALETTTATHTAQIAAVEVVNATQSTQITAIQTVNTTQSNQISAIETVNNTQSGQITAIQALNTTQSGQISALQAAQDLFEGQIGTLFDLRGRDRRDMKQGVASAMAMAQAPMPSEPGRIAYAVNGATFRGEYAVGGSLNYRLNTRAPMAVNVGFSFAGNKNNGVRVGVAGEF